MKEKEIDQRVQSAAVEVSKLSWKTPHLTVLQLSATAGGFGSSMENGNMLMLSN